MLKKDDYNFSTLRKGGMGEAQRGSNDQRLSTNDPQAPDRAEYRRTHAWIQRRALAGYSRPTRAPSTIGRVYNPSAPRMKKGIMG